MPDITKGYTFTDSKADWASEKDTAIRLNKMVDDAKVNIVQGTGISIDRVNGNIRVSATGGGGTVTSVSASGLDGVTITGSPITTSGTISIGLGAITPTSVAASGKISGLNIPDVAFSRGSILVGDNSSPSQYRPLALGVAGYVLTSDGTDAYWDKKSPTLALGDIIYRGALADTYLSGNISITKKFLSQTGTGSISAAPAWDTVTKSDVGLGNVTDHIQTRAAIVPNDVPTSGQILIGNVGNTAYAKQSVSGDITLSHTGAATIASNAVDNTKLADMAASTIKGRQAGSTGDPQDLTSAQATAILDNFTSSLKGLVPSPAGSTRKYLRSDATWVNLPVYNVVDYGVVYNSTGAAGANNTAISSALSDIATAGGGVLYFPPLGTCHISSVISFSSAYNLYVKGGGRGETIINQITSDTGVFAITQYSRTSQFFISDVWLSHTGSNQSSTASAVVCQNNTAGPEDTTPNFTANSVLIDANTSSAQAAFAHGFNLKNQRAVTISDYKFRGRPTNSYGIPIYLDRISFGSSSLGTNQGSIAGSSVPNTAPAFGDYYTISSNGTSQGISWTAGDTAFYGGASGVWSKYVNHSSTKCIGVFITQSSFASGSEGVYIAFDMEGFHISNTDIVGLDYGIRFAGVTTMVHMAVNNCHINVKIAGIWSVNGHVWQAQITGNLIYVGQLGANGRCIYGRFRTSAIAGNSFMCSNTYTGSIGIEITGTNTENSFNNCVSGNIFNAFPAKSVHFNQYTKYCRCVSNQTYEDGTTATAIYVDDGTDNMMELQASTTWNPGTIASGATTFTDFAVTGAKFGQSWVVMPPVSTDVCSATAAVISSGNIRIVLANNYGSSVTIGNGTWIVRRIA